MTDIFLVETVIRALCIIADAHHGDCTADYSISLKHQRRYAWAQDIVRQVARQDTPELDAILGDIA